MKTRRNREQEEDDCYCDSCGEEAHTLYTVGNRQLCEGCKKEMILRKRHQERTHPDEQMYSGSTPSR